jgi:HAD superfamily hydrolase (TIGR01549 family)
LETELNPIEAVLWDLDGTLVSTRRLYLEAYRRALAPYIGRVLTDEEILSHRSRSEIRFLKSQAAEHYDACLRDFRRYYAELHDSHFGGVYPGVADALHALRRREVKLGVVTGKSRSSYEVGAAVVDLGPFDVLVLDDDVSEPKPSPEGIQIAVERLGTAPARTVYVGDAVSDIEAAAAAGVISAAALWSRPGNDTAERMRAAGAAVLLFSPMDVLQLL